jgi:5-methylcytosine-specific restriction endonuclease McrBC regulatory subunit McrC
MKENGIEDFALQSTLDILFDESGISKRTLEPDYYNKNYQIVLDAKYKNAWKDIAGNEDENKKWKTREDVFQVITYMHCFECKNGGIICPVVIQDNKESEGNTELEVVYKKRTVIKNKEEYFNLFGIVIPSKRNDKGEYITYKDFEDKMKKNELAFASKVKEICENAKADKSNVNN